VEGRLVTPAQRDALEVLARAEDDGLGPVQAWKRKSTDDCTTDAIEGRIPKVNMRAAAGLCLAGLARTSLPRHFNPYACDWKYTITTAGRAELR
jgi:hypothetical protein